ncbi:MAG: hypothetical protein PQ975_00465 [Methanobacterium sp.]
MTTFFIKNWNLEFYEPIENQSKEITLETGIDNFEVLKDEKMTEFDKYIVNIKKKTVLFDLEVSYVFKYEKDGDENLTENQKEQQMRSLATVDGNSLLSIFLKYNNIPPFPLLIDIEGSER